MIDNTVMMGMAAIGGAAIGYWLPKRFTRAVNSSPDASVGKLVGESEKRVVVLEQEREQLLSDLHDDVGAKLLDLIYQAESPETQQLARHALADLRAVVSKTRGYPASLLEALHDMQAEAQRRLRQANIEFEYLQSEIPEQALSPARSLQLFRIMREAISNVIRHAQATHLKIKVAQLQKELLIEIKDDGAGMQAPFQPGRGLDSMRNRARDLEGHITFRGGTQGGTRVLLRVPLAD